MQRDKIFFVYILASRPHGVLYVGVTSDLPTRATVHRERLMEGFAKTYWLNRLVYFEHHETAETALPREQLLKRWRRAWKIALIETNNPTWRDLYDEALQSLGIDPT